MTVESRTIERSDLEGKVLADLQQIAETVGVRGHQRLKKGDLIDAIIAASASDGQGGSADPPAVEGDRPATEAPADGDQAPQASDGPDTGQAEAPPDSAAAGNGQGPEASAVEGERGGSGSVTQRQ